jgi:hypothetical protein
LAFIMCRHYKTTKTLGPLASEEAIRITGARAQKRERRQRLASAGRHEALAGSSVTRMSGSDAAFILGEDGTSQQRAHENQKPAVSFHNDLLE